MPPFVSQAHITPSTPPGANLVGGAATFRTWAPAAHAVSLVLGEDVLPLERQGDGHWTGFVEGLEDGDEYMFLVEGDAGTSEKRDPFAR